MVEFAKSIVAKGLRQAGWIQDVETTSVRHGVTPASLPASGPTVMRSPAGLLHAVSSGEIRPLEGRYHVVTDDGRWYPVVYRNGRKVAQEVRSAA